MSIFKTSILATPIGLEFQRAQSGGRSLIFFSALITTMSLVPTLFMLEVYGRVVQSRNTYTLAMLLLLVVLLYGVMELIDLSRMRVMQKVGLRMDMALRERLFDTVFRAGLQRQQVSSAQTLNDLRTVRDFLSSGATFALLDLIGVPLLLGTLFLVSPHLGALALLAALIQVVLAVLTERRIHQGLVDANRAAAEAQSYAGSMVRGAEAIHAFGALHNVLGHWMARQSRFIALQAAASDQAGTSTTISRLVQTLQGSLMLGAACWVSLNVGLVAGGSMLIVASTLGTRVLAPLTQIIAQWRLISSARDAADRLNTLLEAYPTAERAMTLPVPKGRLTSDALVASAPGSNRALLKGIRFAVEPGQALGVIGPSASGKTSLARVLLGIWPATSGSVRLDGADIARWNRDELGPFVGYLPQTLDLFDGTFAENIARFGIPTTAMVEEAAQQAGLGPLLASLPEGLQTRIGTDGAVLSGGMRQRLGLARALYGRPKLVVLDEPDSNLDAEGLQILIAAIAGLKASGAAVVLITHRTPVLAVLDLILLLQDGAPVMFGPRDQVFERMRGANPTSAAPRLPAPALAEIPS